MQESFKEPNIEYWKPASRPRPRGFSRDPSLPASLSPLRSSLTHLQIALVVDEKVLWLKVAVDEVQVVEVLER